MHIDIPVSDPFRASKDPKMGFIALALNPYEVQVRLKHCLFSFHDKQTEISLSAIRVIRYKPGRRCLIEYDLFIEQPGLPPEAITLIGKVRSRGLDTATYRLQMFLWKNDFGPDCADGISVPEPVGVIPEYCMWLQRKVPGVTSTRLLTEPRGILLAERIAQAAHKLHSSDILSRRTHTIWDELRILRECLEFVGRKNPRWAERLTQILDACWRLGATVPAQVTKGIHRDFYPEQVIVDRERLYIIDLDLYCEGDPCLDIGNFLAHLKEQGLRTMGDAEAMIEQEEAMEDRFLQLAGGWLHTSIQMYATLTLVRHIYLSTQFPDRQSFTEPLLELCEQRLSTWLNGTK